MDYQGSLPMIADLLYIGHNSIGRWGVEAYIEETNVMEP